MKSRKVIPGLALALVSFVPGAWAQQQTQPPEQVPPTQQPLQPQDNSQSASPQTPIAPVVPADDNGKRTLPAPAGRGGSIGSGDDDSQAGPEPDTHALAGAETLGVGYSGHSHNLFDPAIHITTSGDTGISSGIVSTVMSAGGTLTLDHAWSRYELTVLYNGAETLYYPDSSDNAAYHELSVLQIIQGRRLTLRLRDDFLDSPAAAFGNLDTGGPGLNMPSGFISNLSPNFLPGETILTGRAGRIRNAALGEVDYALSRRSILTFAGSYGILHFLAAGYIDSSNVDGRAGYSYQLDRKNTVGFAFDYNRVGFGNTSAALGSDTMAASFGRRVTGQLAFQAAAGPQFIYLQNFGVGSGNRWSWNAFSSLTYQRRRTAYSVSYSHGLGNGSGVLQGAETDTVNGSARTVFSKSWRASLNGGYALNSNLATSGAPAIRYGNWFGGVSLTRQLGSSIQASASYGFQDQPAMSVVCPVVNCGIQGLRQVFGITVDFHMQPIVLQ